MVGWSSGTRIAAEMSGVDVAVGVGVGVGVFAGVFVGASVAAGKGVDVGGAPVAIGSRAGVHELITMLRMLSIVIRKKGLFMNFHPQLKSKYVFQVITGYCWSGLRCG